MVYDQICMHDTTDFWSKPKNYTCEITRHIQQWAIRETTGQTANVTIIIYSGQWKTSKKLAYTRIQK